MATINDMDYGSESDDGADFNPAPAVDSDDEQLEDNNPKSRRSPSPRQASPSEKDEVEDGGGDEGEDEGEDIQNEDEEDEDEDEEEDEEDAVTVRIINPGPQEVPQLISFRGALGNVFAATLEINLSISKPKLTTKMKLMRTRMRMKQLVSLQKIILIIWLISLLGQKQMTEGIAS